MLRENFRSLDWDDMEPEEQQRYNLEMFVYDEYKTVNGIRPRWLNFEEMTDEALESMADQISEDLQGMHNDWMKRQAELRAARKAPNGYVWLNNLGKMMDEYVEKVDPDDPDYWSWGYNPAPPANNPFANLFGG